MGKDISRTRKSIYNAITMISNTLIISLISLFATRLIITNYGSDFNGVVATASQFVNLLLIVEGGFTLAIVFALFKPFAENKQDIINSIMAASKKTFYKIGFIFLVVGIITSIVYPFFIKSTLDYTIIFLIFLMVMIGSAYNLMFAVVPRIMFQVNQKEYVYTFYGSLINIASGLTTILLVINSSNMLFVRLSVMLYGMVNGLLIYLLYKKHFPKVDTSVTPDYSKIKGTKDIMIQKITSIIYVSFPMLFIATFVSTLMASVYAVYISIYTIVKTFIHSLVAAPVSGFGQLLTTEKKEYIYEKFKAYEHIVLLFTITLFTTAVVLMQPFIGIYTADVTDISYSNLLLSIMIGLMIFFEVIHTPAGNIINISGNFKQAKKIQGITAIILVILLGIGSYFLGVYGIVLGAIIANVVLSYMEINFVHKKIFNSSLINFSIKTLVNLLLAALVYFAATNLLLVIDSYITFMIYGVITTISIFIIFLSFNYLLYKKDIIKIVNVFLKRNKK